jgi:MFS family permease
MVSGVGMALFFVPLASVVLSSVRPEQEGVASGANSAFREVGGVLGIAVLGAVFSAKGGYTSGTAYVAGLVPAVWVGVAVVGAGALLALALPRRRRARAAADAVDADVVDPDVAGAPRYDGADQVAVAGDRSPARQDGGLSGPPPVRVPELVCGAD